VAVRGGHFHVAAACPILFLDIPFFRAYGPALLEGEAMLLKRTFGSWFALAGERRARPDGAMPTETSSPSTGRFSHGRPAAEIQRE